MSVRVGYSTPGHPDGSRNLLDPVGKYGEANEHSYAAVQIPDRGVVLEHLRTQENGEAHHATHKGVKPWRRNIKSLDASAKQAFLATKHQVCLHIPKHVL